jgi:hypothetical protein
MEHKYIKYKQKYLNLKQIQSGGVDLDNISSTNPTNQTNPTNSTNPTNPSSSVGKKGFYNQSISKLESLEVVLLTKIEGAEPIYLYKSNKCPNILFESNEDVLNTKSKRVKIRVWTPSLSNELPNEWQDCEIKKLKSQMTCVEKIILETRQETGSTQLKASDKASWYQVDVGNCKEIPTDTRLKIVKELDKLGLEIISSEVLKNIDDKIHKEINNSNTIDQNIELSKKLKEEYIAEVNKLSKQVEDIYSTVKHYVEQAKNKN